MSSSKWPNDYYCKKCGSHSLLIMKKDKDKKVCKYCGAELFPFPEECDKYTPDKFNEMLEYLREKHVKTSPEFDPRSFKYREEREAKNRAWWAAREAAEAAGKTTSPSGSPKVECPYCHSTNTKKISTLSKAAHTYMFGIFSMSRNSKNFHCNKCGADF